MRQQLLQAECGVSSSVAHQILLKSKAPASQRAGHMSNQRILPYPGISTFFSTNLLSFIQAARFRPQPHPSPLRGASSRPSRFRTLAHNGFLGRLVRVATPRAGARRANSFAYSRMVNLATGVLMVLGGIGQIFGQNPLTCV